MCWRATTRRSQVGRRFLAGSDWSRHAKAGCEVAATVAKGIGILINRVGTAVEIQRLLLAPLGSIVMPVGCALSVAIVQLPSSVPSDALYLNTLSFLRSSLTIQIDTPSVVIPVAVLLER